MYSCTIIFLYSYTLVKIQWYLGQKSGIFGQSGGILGKCSGNLGKGGGILSK